MSYRVQADALALALDTLRTIASEGIDMDTFKEGGIGFDAVQALDKALAIKPEFHAVVEIVQYHESSACVTLFADRAAAEKHEAALNEENGPDNMEVTVMRTAVTLEG